MVRKVRVALLASALGSWAAWATPACPAQDLPPTPTPVNPSPVAGPPVTVTPPLPVYPPPPPGAAMVPYQDRNGPLLQNDPLLDRPGARPPGWFADLELGILAPHISSGIAGTVNVAGLFSDTVQLPVASLDWTVSPRFVLGYRMCEGLGEVSVAYRSVSTDGVATLSGFDLDGNDGTLKSRLDMNVVDIDYGSQEYSLGSCWAMKWTAGVRIADVYFDSHALGNFLEQKTTNDFVGAGPRIGLDLRRTLGSPELAVYAHVDGSALLGDIKQTYSESVVLNDGTIAGASSIARQDQAVPVLHAEIGLSWAPRYSRHAFHLTGGYEYEQWWYVGQDNGNHADVLLQGVFFRGEWSF